MTVLGVVCVAWFGIIFGAVWGFVFHQSLDPWAAALLGGLGGGLLTSAIGYSWRIDK